MRRLAVYSLLILLLGVVVVGCASRWTDDVYQDAVSYCKERSGSSSGCEALVTQLRDNFSCSVSAVYQIIDAGVLGSEYQQGVVAMLFDAGECGQPDS